MVEDVLSNSREETIGIGMDFAENEKTAPEKFHNAYRLTFDSNLYRTAHAGECDNPPSYIKTCIELLQCDRIDHGYTVLEDEDLTQWCIDHEFVFNIVPTNSHYSKKLAGQNWSKVHPIRHMIDRGVKITVNSDDPPFHNTDPGWSYIIMVDEFGVTIDDIRCFIQNSIDGSWAPKAWKEEWRDEWLKEFDDQRMKLLDEDE
jgi:adenosine deaminase